MKSLQLEIKNRLRLLLSSKEKRKKKKLYLNKNFFFQKLQCDEWKYLGLIHFKYKLVKQNKKKRLRFKSKATIMIKKNENEKLGNNILKKKNLFLLSRWVNNNEVN